MAKRKTSGKRKKSSGQAKRLIPADSSLVSGFEKAYIFRNVKLMRTYHSSYEDKAVECLQELAKSKHFTAIPLLVVAKYEEYKPLARKAESMLKKEFKGFDVKMSLKRCFEHFSPRVRQEAVNAVRVMGVHKKDQEMISWVEETLSDKDAKNRLFAAEALGAHGEEQHLKSLEKMFSDAKHDVRVIAVSSVYMIAQRTGSQLAREILRKALSHEDEDVRRNAKNRLASLEK